MGHLIESHEFSRYHESRQDTSEMYCGFLNGSSTCIEQINKLSFDYINKILLSWRDSGFATVKDVQNAENDYKKKKNSMNSMIILKNGI